VTDGLCGPTWRTCPVNDREHVRVANDDPPPLLLLQDRENAARALDRFSAVGRDDDGQVVPAVCPVAEHLDLLDVRAAIDIDVGEILLRRGESGAAMRLSTVSLSPDLLAASHVATRSRIACSSECMGFGCREVSSKEL